MEFESLISMTENLMEKLKIKGVSDAVLHAGIHRNQQTKFANNKIVKTDVSYYYNVFIFCNINKRIIETTIKDLNEKNLERKVDEILKYAKYLPENKNFEGIADGPFKYKKLKHEKKIMDIEEDIPEMIESAINTATDKESTRNSGVFETDYSESYLLTSSKCEAESIDTNVYFSIRSVYEKDASGHKVYGARTLKELDMDRLAKEASEFAIKSKNPKEINEGRYDILFEPLPLAIILESIADSSSAFEVESGESFLKDKLGKRVGSDEFTLIDDPLIEDGYGSTTFDSEGVPTYTKPIIEKGILKTYLHNTSTAKRWKTETTGNAGLINPHPWNIVLKSGKESKTKMLRDIKKGLWITNAWYMRFHNTLTGEFSVIPRDAIFYIENGEIKYPVKNIRVNSKLEEIMKNTIAVGKEKEKIHSWEVSGSVITPAVLIEKINVTKPTK